MNFITGQQVSAYVDQITALNASLAACSTALSSNASLINVQLAGQVPIDLSKIGLTPAQTVTILTSLQTFLQNLLNTTTASLTAVP